MIKVFLSHSWKQKKFILQLADLIGRDFAIVDNFEFEPARPIWDEIQKSLGYTNIFVFLASKESLNSDWCQKELESARELEDQGKLIFCAYLIDKSVKVDDFKDNIKTWVKKWLIKTYTSAPLLARAITKRINEEIWVRYPEALPRLRTFAGRGEEMSEIQTLLLKENMSKIRALVVSGFQNVGRKTILRKVITEGIQKTFHPSYEPIKVSLTSTSSIDAFIQQLNNIVRLYSDNNILELCQSAPNSHDAAIALLNKIADSNERIIIADDRCIVTPQGMFVDWFSELVQSTELSPLIHFFIASRIKPKNTEVRKLGCVREYSLAPMTLEKETLLFNQYCDVVSYQPVEKEVKPLLLQLNGYPEQVLDLVDTLKDGGLVAANESIDEIAHRFDDNMQKTLDIFRNNEHAMRLLIIMSHIGFASVDLLRKFYEDDDFYTLMAEFCKFGLYENFGPGKEFIRLNTHLADFIDRYNLKLKGADEKAYKEKVKAMIQNDDSDSEDLALQLYTIREQLLDPRFSLSVKYLLPSVILQVVSELYYSEQNESVVALAKRMLYERDSSHYNSIERSLRYWMCLAYCKLGRTKDVEKEFFEEVDNLQGYHNAFLKGFYFRCKQQYPRALTFYNKALEQANGIEFAYVAKAKHEKVIVLMSLDNYYEAHSLARENYERDKTNTFHIDAYFRCHIRSCEIDTAVIDELISAMDSSYDSRKDHLVPTYKAEYIYRKQRDIPTALDMLEDILTKYPDRECRYTIEVYKEICSKQKLMVRFNTFMNNIR